MLLRLLPVAALVVAGGLCCGGLGRGPDVSTPPDGQPRFVSSATTLKLRASPSTTAAEVGEVAHGERVIVTGPSSGSEVASGVHGGWVPAWYAGKTGYLFDGFLLPVPPPPPGCADLSAWATSIGTAGPPVTLAKTRCADMGIEGMETCDETTRTPLDHQAALITNTGYEWGSVTLHLPNTTADQAWAGARQCFTGQPNLSGEALPTVAGVSASVHMPEEEVSTVVDGKLVGWEWADGCASYVHVTTVGLDAEVTAGGGC